MVTFGSVTFFVRELDNTLPESVVVSGCTVGMAAPSNVDQLVAGYDYSRSVEVLLGRFRSGHRCVIALDAHGDVVHCRWVATGSVRIPELRMDLVLGTGETYFYDGYTRRDARGRGLDGTVRCFIFQTMRSAGFTTAYSYARGDNIAGLKVARRWQRSAGRLWYLTLPVLGALVIGKRGLGRSRLVRQRTGERAEDETSFRTRVWRDWFESWLCEPLAKRSTGFSALSDESLASTADYIGTALRLDPESDVVLDVGCDSAMVSRLVAKRCRRLVGVDFIPGLLATIPEEVRKPAHGRPPVFVAADGRCLPFQSHVFTKVYCSAVLHTLPSQEDGLRMIEELVRVCQPGGAVLVAAVPDQGKRIPRYVEAWKGASITTKVQLMISLAIPVMAKDCVRRLLGLPRRHKLVFLDYDLEELKGKLRARGLACDILHFPPDYWSRDFRATRSNLIIRIPRERAAAAP